MTYSQKYCLVAFLQPITTGSEFHMNEWPLHITLADVFAVDRNGTNLDEQLARTLKTIHCPTVTALSNTMLGTTPVTLIEATPALRSLHTEIIDLLEKNGAIFNTPEFTRTGFLPHSTVQDSGRLNSGDKTEIDSISLVDMFPGGDWQQRKVLNNFNLKQA